jgi:predicted molibdopterin-dependent oxidoreductase YjgC
MGGNLGAHSAEAMMKEISALAPAYRGVTWDLLDWGAGREGVVLPLPEGEQPLQYLPVDPGLRARAAAGLTLHLGRVLYDDGVLTRMSPSLAGLMPEAAIYMTTKDARSAGVEAGHRVEVTTELGYAELEVMIDNSLAPRTVYVPFNLPETSVLGASPGVTVHSLDEVAG